MAFLSLVLAPTHPLAFASPSFLQPPQTGRAKKRVQYVKRFVTVVPTFGGKRPGPNPAPQKGLPGAAAAAAGKK